MDISSRVLCHGTIDVVPLAAAIAAQDAAAWNEDEQRQKDYEVHRLTQSIVLLNASAVKDNFNEEKLSGGRLATLWKVNDRADVLFNVTAQNDQVHGDWLSDPALGDAKITRFVEQSRHVGRRGQRGTDTLLGFSQQARVRNHASDGGTRLQGLELQVAGLQLR